MCVCVSVCLGAGGCAMCGMPRRPLLWAHAPFISSSPDLFVHTHTHTHTPVNAQHTHCCKNISVCQHCGITQAQHMQTALCTLIGPHTHTHSHYLSLSNTHTHY